MVKNDNITAIAKIYKVSRQSVRKIQNANKDRIAELLQKKKEAIDKQFTDYFKRFHTEGSKVVLGLLAELWNKRDTASFKDLAIALGIIADKLDGKVMEQQPTELIIKWFSDEKDS